jgi:hypothetical protein
MLVLLMVPIFLSVAANNAVVLVLVVCEQILVSMHALKRGIILLQLQQATNLDGESSQRDR